MPRAKILPDNKTITVEPGETAGQLLAKAGMSSETGVVIVNGQPVTEDYRINENDEIVVVRVLSGGQV